MSMFTRQDGRLGELPIRHFVLDKVNFYYQQRSEQTELKKWSQ